MTIRMFAQNINYGALSSKKTIMGDKIYARTSTDVVAVWRSSYAYIAMAETGDGGCERYPGGPEKLRVCLEEYPTKVFFPYV